MAAGRPSTKKREDPLDTPMMRQYLELKKNHPDAILFFRMGDFYELFLEDAQAAAPLMDIALTARQNAIPMAGVPYHSVDTYVARLIAAGKKVAIAEQEADPVNPKLMRRAVRRIITPGTLVEDALLDSSSHNYLLAVVIDSDRFGLALADVSTGDFSSMEFGFTAEDEGSLERRLRDCYVRYAPGEVLAPADDLERLRQALPELGERLTALESWKASPTEGARRLERDHGTLPAGLGHQDLKSPALGAAALIMHYVSVNFPDGNVRLDPPVFIRAEGERMQLDEETIRNLDLTYNYQEGGQRRTVYAVLNFCRTASGKRRLKAELTSPLLKRAEIEQRLDSVAELLSDVALRTGLAADLEETHDLERMLGRAGSGRGAPRDFGALRDSVRAAERIHARLRAGAPGSLAEALAPVEDEALGELVADLDTLLHEELPTVLGKGMFAAAGIDPELDRAREASEHAAQWLLDFEKAERERSGIAGLKIRYNKVFGYYIEISKAHSDRAPADYDRKQTLVNAERFTTEKLRELEQAILESGEVIERIEKALFQSLTDRLLNQRSAIKAVMSGVATVDFLLSLADAAAKRGWVRPQPVESGESVVEQCRHPVVEAFLPTDSPFTPNDVRMDSIDRSFAVITGPNMAGKSTYIRQVALVQLLMQIGSFVPARHATLGIADRIFTRIGASDNLTRGESTFFVEMLETARILNQATERSLVIMDEVGRGTSTYDGLSIAWAVAEYMSGEGPNPRVLFATHYHELTVLESRTGVFNLTMDVQEVDGRVIFMHRIREGSADRSYGIHVARLAGLPPVVTERAIEKLSELEAEYRAQKEKPPRPRLRPRKARDEGSDTPSQGMLFPGS